MYTYLKSGTSINCGRIQSSSESCPFSSLVKIYRRLYTAVSTDTHILDTEALSCCWMLLAAGCCCVYAEEIHTAHTQIAKGKNIYQVPPPFFFLSFLGCWDIYSISSCVYNRRDPSAALVPRKIERDKKKVFFFPFCFPMLDSPQIYICWGAEKLGQAPASLIVSNYLCFIILYDCIYMLSCIVLSIYTSILLYIVAQISKRIG